MKRTSTHFFRMHPGGLIAVIAMLLSFTASAQLTGTKNIPGDYATISSAISDLNLLGVGPGGVTFDVAAGHTETGMMPVITATGTAADPIVFQRSGVGANPVVTAGTGVSTTLDGVFTLSGTDYITFDGIDVQENSANTTNTMRMEWGYGLVKASATNGCQFVTIMNCNISLNRTNTASVGINSMNNTAASTASVTITAASGTHSNNEFSGNTISNVYLGIRVAGYLDAAPYAFYDQNNKIGTAFSGNIITNFAGAGTTTYGIYAIYQNNLIVANNDITSGTGHTAILYGIFLSTGVNSNADVFANTVSLNTSATTSTVYGINNAMGGSGTSNTINIFNNTVHNMNWTSATSSAFYAIYTTASSFNANVFGNTVANITKTGTGAMYAIYVSGAVVNTVTLHSNSVNNITLLGTGSLYGLWNSPATTAISQVYNNTVHSNSAGGTHYGVYNSTSNTADIYQNTVYNNTTSSAAGTIAGIYLSAGTTYNVYRNKVYDITTTGSTGEAYGLYSTTGTTRTIHNNIIGNIFAPNTSNVNGVAGIYVNSGSAVNLYYNTIYLNASSTGANFGTSGIYTSTTPTVDLRNNIVVNTSTASGTGITAAYRRSSATLTSFAASSNNNLYYVGTPSATKVIYYDGTNSDQTLAAYQLRMAPAESASISENPPFLSTIGSSPNFLHINPSVATGIESGAVAIPGITDDYDALNVRTGYPLAAQANGGGAAPDIGADEGDFSPIPIDMGATALISPVPNMCYGANETVRIRIKNYSAVTIDMGVNPITINASVTGPNPVTFPALVLSSGTIAGGATLDTIVSTYNMSATGVYTFNASTSVTGDGNASNNTMAPATITISAGTASLSPSSICLGGQSVIMLSNYSGTLQWQSYDAANMTWVNETGAGNTSASYTITPTDTIIYRALVCGMHPSNADTLEVIDVQTPTASNAARCGAGVLPLSASGTGTMNWYDAPAGGNLVHTGAAYSPNLSVTDTFYVEATTGPVINPLKITEIELGTNDAMEIQNLSAATLNTAGWKVAISDDYSLINDVNTILWNLPATIAPGQILTRTDLNSSPNYWGNNMFWNPGSNGWAMIIDNNGVIVDFVAWQWGASNIQAMNPTINGNPTMIGTQWSGAGIPNTGATTGLGLSRQGNMDNNDASDFIIQTLSLNALNPGLSAAFPAGCTSPSRAQVIATINSVPVVALGNDTIFCEGPGLVLDAANTGDSYSWSTGASTQTVLADTTGMYAVTVTTSAMCSAADTINVTVNPNPVVSLGSDIVQCGGSTTLDPGPAYVSFSWSTGATTQTISANTTGNYIVTVQNGFLCSNSDTVMVTINPNPVVTLGTDSSFCSNSTMVLNAGNAGMNYAWSEGSTSQTITVNTADTFSVVVTNPATGCIGYDTIVTSLDALPVVNLGSDINQCGGSVTLNAGNPGSAYLWTSGYVSQTIPVATSGTYWVQVTNAAGCSSNDTINVAINNVPAVNLGADITQCGGTVMLNAGNAGSSYIWSHGPSSQTTTINTTGNYSVIVITAQNCTNTDTVMVTINSLPLPYAGNDTTICNGATVVLNAGAGYASYQWTVSSIIIDTTQTVSVAPSVTTMYELDVVDANGCASANPALVTITVEQAPVASFTSTLTGGFNASFTNNTASSTTLPFTSSWNFGDASAVSTTTNPAHTYTANGTYTVTLIVTTACGADTTTQTVVVTGVGIEEANMLKEVKVYPNPSTGVFNLELVNAAIGELTVTVTDMTGRTVYNSVEEVKGDLNRTLDLSPMAKGVYYLKMESENMIEIRKIVLQ